MNTRSTFLLTLILFTAASIVSSSFGQGESASPSAASTSVATEPVAAPQMSEAEMMKQMMEMSKINDNHKLLTSLDGTWNFTNKMWMDGNTANKPQESKGTAVRKSIMGGRYVVMDVNGKMQMPGADGKPKDFDFKGQGTEGYDNVKKKFVATWVDNMGTGIMTTEGDYDPATKTMTSTGEIEMIPGMKQHIREVIKLADKDHMSFEWYETRGPQEVKTMEIDYTRASKAK
jgi:hypothetical protein